MRPTTAASVLSIASATAYPSQNTTCISAPDALLIAQGFGQILSNFTQDFGNILIADGYTDQSDSVATLMHSLTSPNVTSDILGATTFDSKAAFLAGEAAQPGVNFTLLNTWSSCDAVTFRYVVHPAPLDVQGIAVAEVVSSINGTGVGSGELKWQIKTFYGEFNSAVWLTDLGAGDCDVAAATAGGNSSANSTLRR